MVQFSAQHLLGLINDLLDLSRIESGKMEVFLEHFRSPRWSKKSSRRLRPGRQQKSLTSEADTRRDPGAAMVCDRKKFFQILLNLANNAVKFTEHGSVKIKVRGTREAVTVSVIDTGIGIKPENLANLFQAFRQVDGSARRVYEGTGLGLYLCRATRQMLGGHIDVQSEFGSGSCFRLTLPREFPAQPMSATILLVEDNAANRYLATFLLEKAGSPCHPCRQRPGGAAPRPARNAGPHPHGHPDARDGRLRSRATDPGRSASWRPSPSSP